MVPRQPARRRVALLPRLALLLGVCLSASVAQAFTMTDHAIKAIVRPYPQIDAWQAEQLEGAPADAVVADERAINGQAVRLTVEGPTLSIERDFERGTFSLWCIGRSGRSPTRYREPMYVHLRVIDLDDDANTRQWRMRINYMGNMYQDVAHLYVDINRPGRYRLEFSLGHGSHFDLLVDRLVLRDVLAGTFKQGFKQSATLYTNPAPRDASIPPFDRTEALRLGRNIAASFPPRNSIKASGGMPTPGYYHEFSLSGSNLAEVNAGRWAWSIDSGVESPWRFTGPVPKAKDQFDALLDGADAGAGDASPLAGAQAAQVDAGVAERSFGVAPEGDPQINWGTANAGQRGEYTAEDYHAFRAAPARWPDDGGGYFVARESFNLDDNFYYNWMAVGFKSRMVEIRSHIEQLADQYYHQGDERAGLRAALLLAHYADHFPSLDHTVQGTMNTIWGAHPFNTFSGTISDSSGKVDYSGHAGSNNLGLVHAYDKLFPLIKDNALLAEAIGQTIEWVHEPGDVVELIDVKLLQHFYDAGDRRQVRFSSNLRADPIIALVQGNNEAGRHMLQQLVYNTTFDHQSVLDGFVTRRSRDSTSFIGSMFYAKGPSLNAGMAVADITRFAQQHDLPELVLTDPAKTTILQQSAQWLIEPFAAGVHVNGVGDVSGPLGTPYMARGDNNADAQRVLLGAWEAYDDPRFAWMLEHVHGMPPFITDAQRDAIRQAAATLPHDPRVNQPSRSLGGFGVTHLEVNGDDPDFRNRAALVLRSGYGSGHSHDDQLNLELFARGLVMAPEFGGRPGYAQPPTGAVASHNTVAVDGDVSATGRTRYVAHLPGAPVAEAQGGNIRRFVSLIDAGDGNAYVFDIVRAVGGKQRTYWFHGSETDTVDEQAATRASRMGEVTGAPANDLFDSFAADLARESAQPNEFDWNPNVFSHNLEGNSKAAPPVYQAVWPMAFPMEEAILRRIAGAHGRGEYATIPEHMLLRDGKRKFTRLILFNSEGRTVATRAAVSPQVGYRIMLSGVSETRRENEPSVFPALIEPFAGEAFITGFEPLKVNTEAAPANDATDDAPWAGAAVPSAFAVRVNVGEARRDLIMHSDAPAALHRTAGKDAFALRGQYAFVSRDERGLRAASLVAGRELIADDIRLTLATAQHEANIAEVDYLSRSITLDRRLPLVMGAEAYVRIGRDGELFRITRSEHDEQRTTLHHEKSAEAYRSPLYLIDKGQAVVGVIEPEHRHAHGHLANEAHDKVWPLSRAGSSSMRWMGTGFRGGAHMGGELTWDHVPDVDGDGKRTLTLGPDGGPWTTGMLVEVLDIDPERRVFVYRPVNRPEGYSGSRSYTGHAIINERGEVIAHASIPGRMGEFRVAEGTKLTDEDFPDTNGDGQARFHVYYFGPGDPVQCETYAALRRADDNQWHVHANAPVTIELIGASVQLQQDGTWRDLPGEAADGGRVRFALDEDAFTAGRAVVRVIGR